MLLASCTTGQPKTYALDGIPVVGEIVRVEPAGIWVGDVGPSEGQIFWLRTNGPKQRPIVFASYGKCPSPNPGKDRYLVILKYERLGYEVPESVRKELTGLVAQSCTRVDPDISYFSMWREQ
jgi:hypothetical protein